MPSAAAPSRRASPLPAGERRTAIIHAVLPLLIEQGPSVTTKMLATAARVSEGTLFNVFADKDELIAAAVEAAIDLEPFERAVAAIDATLPFRDRLVEATALIQRRVVDIWRLVSLLGPNHHPDRERGPLPDSPALIALLDSDSDRLREPAVDAARLLRALTLSLTHPLMTAPPRSAEQIVDVYLDGVGR